jgi:hypothetical protein
MRILWDQLPAGDYRLPGLLPVRDAFLLSAKTEHPLGAIAS